ncbi:MAG: formylmethanofuran dehydrogenase subunit C [Pirellulaceae bacterium]|nr:formylmethanofuran dehydrogenase subunit C [Pirellulaceae bacterium]
MSTITLNLRQQPTVALEAEVISPDAMADLSHADICALKVYHGKRVCRLDEFFDIDGERSDTLEINGNLHRVRMMGRGMTRGQMTINGNVGMHLGSHMSGGKINVDGDAGDWIGAEMTGGFIRVRGNGGGQIGAAYRGSLAGMRAGTIIIDGTAGIEIGMRMRRGTIVVGGVVRDFAGLQMKGGTIVMLSGAEIRTGAWMNRGTIISLKPLQLMPTFAYSGNYNPTFINVYAKHLSPHGIKIPYAASDGSYDRYCGDMGVTGKGEVLVWNEK